jgi:hypothetical protein
MFLYGIREGSQHFVLMNAKVIENCNMFPQIPNLVVLIIGHISKLFPHHGIAFIIAFNVQFTMCVVLLLLQIKELVNLNEFALQR